jgi:catechol 2,3-dioxygenase-like lactoylglutathione lyase family enzyme
MYDHIGLHVRDLNESCRFYEAVLAPLGYVACSRDDTNASFGRKDEPALYLYAARGATGPGTHVAFRAQGESAVREFHARGLKAGASDHGTPGVRADYGPGYYAAFLLDPDGNNVEAVCNVAH